MPRPNGGLGPLRLGEFVGRGREATELAALIVSHRLVTITGAPGVGKTRLAREVAVQVADAADVYMVDLEPVAGPEGVTIALAAQLGATPAGGEAPDRIAAVAARLERPGSILVLDNCEHVAGAASDVVERLLRACHQLRVLATSREALGVVGEAVLPLTPLALQPPEGSERAQDAVGAEAVQLFCARAAVAHHGFVPTPDSVPAIVEICRRLDGIPLAIELAAARLAVLSLPEVVVALDDRFTLLASPTGSGGAGHRSFRAALDRSHELLSSSERVMLRRLSVFPAGCTLEAAEEVAAGGEIHTDDVLDLLNALVAKSLVIAHTASRPSRYCLLESIRTYAFGRLAQAGETGELQARHARWCIQFFDRAPRHAGGAQDGWLEQLEAEEDNLSAAMGWAVADGRVRVAAGLVARVIPLWWARGRYREAQEWLERALRLKGRFPAPLRVKLLCDVALSAMMRGDLGTARAHAEEALALSTELGDDRGSTESLRLLGFIATLNGEPRRGLELIDQAVALARADSDASALAHALAARARTHLFQGHGAAGLDDFEASLAVAQRIDLMAVMNARMGIGWAALCVGQYDRAEVQLPLALASARRIGDRHATATALAWMGELRRVRGDDAGARSYLDESVAIATDIATPHPLGRALLSLGRIALANGDTAASEHFERAITIARTSTLPFLLAPCLTALGEIELGGGDRARARQLLDEALARARDCDDRAAEAHALHGLGDVARAEGDDERGAQLHLDALALRAAIGDQPGLADSLEALGGLVADDGRTLVAARLFAAAERLRDKGGFIRPGWRQARYHADVAAAREGSDPGEFDVAWREGAALSVAEAVAYASKGRGRRKRPATGWEALTPAERQVVQLVAQGMTNPETAERLFISTETVKAHLSRAYQKLGVRSRRDLRSAVRPQQ